MNYIKLILISLALNSIKSNMIYSNLEVKTNGTSQYIKHLKKDLKGIESTYKIYKKELKSIYKENKQDVKLIQKEMLMKEFLKTFQENLLLMEFFELVKKDNEYLMHIFKNIKIEFRYFNYNKNHSSRQNMEKLKNFHIDLSLKIKNFIKELYPKMRLKDEEAINYIFERVYFIKFYDVLKSKLKKIIKVLEDIRPRKLKNAISLLF